MESTISKTTKHLTTAEDMRNQTKLIMQPYANWEEYLTPAPLSIAILGELVFISSATDFSINKNSPKDGYKFIKYPESFRACLMQVCNSGWWAFNEAHKSMDQIRLHTSQVPDYMKTAVRILFQDDDEVVQAHLPDQLKNIQLIADQCVELSEKAEKGFTNVISIIQELLEACINAEHFYGDQMEKMKKKIEENKLREQSALETKKRTEKAARVLEEELENANKNYQKAMDSLPNGFDLLGMCVVEGLTKTVSSVVSGLTFGGMAQMMAKKVISLSSTADEVDYIDEITAFSKSEEILSLAQNIKLCAIDQKGNINWKNIYDQKEKNTKTAELESQFHRIKNDLEKMPNSPAKTQSLSVCNMGIALCEQLAIFAPNGKCDEENVTKIKETIASLNRSALTFNSKSKDRSHVSGLTQKSPMLSQQNSSGDASAVQLAVQNAQTAIEQTQAQLNKTKMRYDKCMENFEQNQKELTEILVSMRNCELKKIDFETTIEMLVKGMDAMGKVKEQWEKMVHFFQMVSNIVKISMSKTLTNFVSTAEKTQALSYKAKLFSKDLLYNQAFFASNVASLVHMISGTYTDISNKYLMDRVSSLGKLMAMDKSKPEFETEIQKLRDGCDEAKQEIRDLVLRNKEEFEKSSAKRLERINTELLAILPASPPEEIKKIQDAVKDGFSDKADEALYY